MKSFKFKQFHVQQDIAAMKVGTDGVLLGAWVDLDFNPYSILDVGAGTGILSLMIAQRLSEKTGHFEIEAIEIEEGAYEECVVNFEQSPWREQIYAYHASLIEFAQEVEETFDFIICNPPFYTNFESDEITPRSLARSAEFMPLEHIFAAFKKLSQPQTGQWAIILPYEQEEMAMALAELYEFHLQKVLYVKGNPDSPIKRICLQFGQEKIEKPKQDSLIIETERHQYTEAYRELVKDFYLDL